MCSTDKYLPIHTFLPICQSEDKEKQIFVGSHNKLFHFFFLQFIAEGGKETLD